MPPLLVVTALSLLGLAVVWWGLLRDGADALEDDADPSAALPPDWGVLPTPSDLARIEFGLRVPGYDPASVDRAFDALAALYTDLLESADERTRARARRRIAQRLGREVDADAPRRAGVGQRPATIPSSTTDEAIAAAVALDAIDHGER